MFAYEIPSKVNNNKNDKISFKKTVDSLLVYNFHSIINARRFFFFIKTTDSSKNFFLTKKNNSILSITENFLNAN